MGGAQRLAAGLGRRLTVAAAVVAAAVLAGCGVPVVGATTSPARPAARPATAQPAHLVVVIEENHSFEQVIGSGAAPFINSLAARGSLLTDYHAISHPSLPNYLAILSGGSGRIRSDCARCTIAGPTLVDQLEARRISWAAYLEGLPQRCSSAAGDGAYTEAVNPFMHATRVRDTPARCDRVLPFREFHDDLAAGRLPTVTFVVPNLRHSMHSGPVAVADAWLRRLFGELAAGPVWRQGTRTVVTFDEGARTDVRSCCDGLGRGGLIPTIVDGPGVLPGRDPTPYTHYSLLRSIEAEYGLPFLGHAGDRATATIPAVAGQPGTGRAPSPLPPAQALAAPAGADASPPGGAGHQW